MTSFSKGEAPETFVYRVKDNSASLMSYYVDGEGLSKN
jgi:hypothetical protein